MDLLIISKVIKKNVFLINDDVGIAVVVSRIPFCAERECCGVKSLCKNLVCQL